MENPYEYYNGKLGVKISFIVDGSRCHHKSLRLVSPRTLRYRMNSKNRSEKRLRRACLGMDALILFSSLSRDWKDQITTTFGDPETEIKRSWFAQNYIADGNARDFYIAHRYGDKNEKKLDLRLIDQYTYNASVLNTVIKMRSNRKAYAKALGGVQFNMWKSLSKDVNHFTEVSHNLPQTPDGLRYKVSKYEKALKESQEEAYKTLISGKLMNKNAAKVESDQQKALLDELIGKHTNLDNTLISQLYNVVAEKMNWKTIDPMTVFNRKRKKNLITYAGRNGVRELEHNLSVQAKRSRPSAPMILWSLDGWDVELLYQATRVNKDGYKVTTYHNRLTIVVVLDPHNDYPIGYAIGTNESPDLIKLALKNAMNHVSELFGELYRPYQIQSDNYAKKTLLPTYEALTPHYTPAEVGNAKAKPIERYFGEINRKYCKLMDNWSGHNIDSGSANQPNREYLDKIKKNFPDREGCEAQIHSIINQERAKKQKEYIQNWKLTEKECKTILNTESYFLALGTTTGRTNKLRGEGIRIRIAGEDRYFDSFDINFRHQAHQDWQIYFDEDNLEQVLAVSKDGTERFILEEKYLQPMALADRKEGDAEELQKIFDYKRDTREMITEERAQNADILDDFFSENHHLNDTMAKMLLTDSLGQHKNYKSAERLKAAENAQKIELKAAKKQTQRKMKAYADEEADYYAGKIDINEYLNDN